MVDTTIFDRAGWINGLREFADFLERHPDLEIRTYSASTVLVPCDEDEISAAARLVGGWDKVYAADYMNLNRTFGPLVLQLFCSRSEVCTPKRTQTVIEEVPDSEWIRERIAEIREQAPTKVIEREEVLEWECRPLLATDKAAR